MDIALQKALAAAGLIRRAVSTFIRSDVGPKARLLGGTLLGLMLAITTMNVVNSFVARHFMSAIERREIDDFTWLAWMYAGVFAVSTVLAVEFRFTEERLGLLWREWLTKRAVTAYMQQEMYLHAAISNPDQRIAEDIRMLTVTTLSFVLMMLNSLTTAVSFAGVLWTISWKLFLVAVVYALVGSALTIFLGRRLVQLNYQQTDCEANFRAELIRMREDGAEIAATEGGPQSALEQLLVRLSALAENLRKIFSVNRSLGFFTTGYNYMIQLIPTLIVAPIFIARGTDFGIIAQSAMAFSTVVAALSLIVSQFHSISSYAAVVTRLSELVEEVEKL